MYNKRKNLCLLIIGKFDIQRKGWFPGSICNRIVHEALQKNYQENNLVILEILMSKAGHVIDNYLWKHWSYNAIYLIYNFN